MNLSIHQSQSTILTPQLQNSLAILKAPAQELSKVLAQIAETNPCFEPADGGEIELPPEDGAEPPLDILVSDRFCEAEMPQEVRDKLFVNMPSRNETLEDYLTKELSCAGFGLDILPFINERGWFTGCPLKFSYELAFIRTLSPKGLGAYDATDCLLMQLPVGCLEAKALLHHSELLIRRKIPLLSVLLGVTLAEVEGIYVTLSKLNCNPASEFLQPEPSNKLPEVFLDDEGNITGEFSSLPKYKVSQSWLSKLAHSDEETRIYLRDKLKDAKFYLRAINQRNSTIVRVFEAIYKVQSRFFTHDEPLLPLTMGQIALEVGLHETTVSRAVSGKYVSTPKGVFELRKFFSLALIDSSGELISNNVVKQAVLDCISGEDKSRPFSDEEIMRLLKLKGLDIARRTIAKYRSLAGIPNSNQRVVYAKHHKL